MTMVHKNERTPPTDPTQRTAFLNEEDHHLLNRMMYEAIQEVNINHEGEEEQYGREDNLVPAPPRAHEEDRGLLQHQQEETSQQDEEVMENNNPVHPIDPNNSAVAAVYPSGSIPLLTIMSPISQVPLLAGGSAIHQQYPRNLLHQAEDDQDDYNDTHQQEREGERRRTRTTNAAEERPQEHQRDNSADTSDRRHHENEREWALSQGRAFSSFLEDESRRLSPSTGQRMATGHGVAQDSRHHVLDVPTSSRIEGVASMAGQRDDNRPHHGLGVVPSSSRTTLDGSSLARRRRSRFASSFLRRRTTYTVRAAIELINCYDEEDRAENNNNEDDDDDDEVMC